MTISRRVFLGTTIAGSLALGVSSEAKDHGFPADPQNATSAPVPASVQSSSALAMDTNISIVRFEHLSKGGDTLDSAI